MNTYPINEIFRSLQGEGTYSGRAAVFVRFSGCNLKCGMCDTDHESHVEEMSACTIVRKIEDEMGSEYDLIVLTGGEPLLHLDAELYDYLMRYTENVVCVETNGTLEFPKIGKYRCLEDEERLHITWSPKCPKSFRDVRIPRADQIKIVVPGGDVTVNGEKLDVENSWTKERLIEFADWADEDARFMWAEKYLQPTALKDVLYPIGLNYMQEVALSDPRWQVSIQLHKYLGIK